LSPFFICPQYCDQVVAINPLTGQPYSFFVVANSTSGLSGNPNVVSFANFSTALANASAAGANGIVYAYTPKGSTAPTLAGFTIPDGTKVISSAPTLIPVSFLAGIGGTTSSNLPLPSGTGIFPIVNGTVTLASGSNQIISGYDIRPNSPGIIGTNNINATIADNIIAVTTSSGGNDRGISLSGFSGNTNVSRNTISNSVNTGILLQNGSGNPTVSNNNVTITAPNTSLGLNGRGILLSNVNATTTTIDGNVVSGAIGEGIRFDNVTGNAAITNNTVLNTIQPRIQTGLEASIFVRTGAGNLNLNISGNTVGDNNRLSTFDNNGTTPVAQNEIDGIEVSVCRLYGDGIGGCPATTTAIVNISNNIVRNITSPAAAGDGIDINLDTNAIARFTISNNNVFNISDKGISFGADGASKGSAVISNNTFNGMGENGIQVRVAQTTGATADLSSPVTLGGVTTSGVVISGNQIANTGQSGIRLRTEKTGQLTATVNNNSISNANNGSPAAATDEGGILVRTQDTSIIRATLTNNTVSNTSSTTNSGGFLFRKQSLSNLCVKVQNNQSSNSAVVDYRFNQTGVLGLQLSGISTAITTTTLLQNALLAQGNTGATFGITGTVSVPTSTCNFP
jgi:parallel beta-helix repeat protein